MILFYLFLIAIISKKKFSYFIYLNKAKHLNEKVYQQKLI